MHDDASSPICYIFATLSQKTRKHIQVPAPTPKKYLPTENEIFDYASVTSQRWEYLVYEWLRHVEAWEIRQMVENMLSGKADETEWMKPNG